MKNVEKVISPAYAYADGEVVLPVIGKGTSWELGIKQWLPTPVDFTEPTYTGTPAIRLQQTHAGVHAITNEGEDLVFTVMLREAIAADTSGTWTLTTTEDGLLTSSVSTELLEGMDSDASNTEDTYPPLNRLTTVNDADLSAKTGTWTVLAGDTTATITINTVDDVLFTGGANTYRYTEMTITSDDGLVTYPEGVGLIQDVSLPSYCNGTVNVRARRDELLPTEDVVNAITQSPLTLLVGEGYESYGIKNTNISEFRFTPLLGSFVTQDAGIDPNGVDYLYQVIIQVSE